MNVRDEKLVETKTFGARYVIVGKTAEVPRKEQKQNYKIIQQKRHTGKFNGIFSKFPAPFFVLAPQSSLLCNRQERQ